MKNMFNKIQGELVKHLKNKYKLIDYEEYIKQLNELYDKDYLIMEKYSKITDEYYNEQKKNKELESKVQELETKLNWYEKQNKKYTEKLKEIKKKYDEVMEGKVKVIELPKDRSKGKQVMRTNSRTSSKTSRAIKKVQE